MISKKFSSYKTAKELKTLGLQRKLASMQQEPLFYIEEISVRPVKTTKSISSMTGKSIFLCARESGPYFFKSNLAHQVKAECSCP